MKIVYFWLTPQGKALAEQMQELCGGRVMPKENFAAGVEQAFREADALVFVMAAGIVVRTIAPLLRSKAEDPAVLVLDQQGTHVISLLSGHLGGANALTRTIAEKLGSDPVITTATDTAGILSFDEFAKANQLKIENLPVLKHISGTLLEGKTVAFQTDIPTEFPLPPYLDTSPETALPYGVKVSDRQILLPPEQQRLLLRPKSLVLGVGCKRGISPEHLLQCAETFLEQFGLSRHSVSAIATIGLKAEEPAVLALSRAYAAPLVIVPAEEIQSCTYPFAESEFVRQITGVPAVAEACSYLASGCGEVLTGKRKFPGVTLAACRKKMPPLHL